MRRSAMPLEGPLVDRYGRVHDDLRISVTDRCNLRCVYCMPEEGLSFLRMDQLLTFDEITRVARVARSLGVTALRITGGEPLVRKGLPVLIARLAALGFEDLAVTTNGTELAGMAEKLASAGLRRVNVSCDSLRPERFAAIRRRGVLSDVLRAMDAAEAAGLTPLKVNVVLLRGRNDDEILDFASFARATGRIVRFIEFMPLDAQGDWDRAHGSYRAARSSIASPHVGRWNRCQTPQALPPSGSASPTGSARSASSRASRSPSVARATASGSRRTALCGTASSPTTKRPCGTSCATTAPMPSSPSC